MSRVSQVSDTSGSKSNSRSCSSYVGTEESESGEGSSGSLVDKIYRAKIADDKTITRPMVELAFSTDMFESSGSGDRNDAGAEDRGQRAGTSDRWSVGTELHEAGTCKPCLYINTRDGCFNGRRCKFCHAEHKRNRPRPSKSERQRCKQLIADANRALEQGSTREFEEMQDFARQSPYMQSLLRGQGGQESEGTQGSIAQAAGSASSSGLAWVGADQQVPDATVPEAQHPQRRGDFVSL